MCDEREQQLVSELTVTQVQLCQHFREVQHLGQTCTGPLIQCGVTEVQLSTQGSTQGHCPSHCVPLTAHRNQGHQLEEDSFTGSKQENQSTHRLLRSMNMDENQLLLWCVSLCGLSNLRRTPSRTGSSRSSPLSSTSQSCRSSCVFLLLRLRMVETALQSSAVRLRVSL